MGDNIRQSLSSDDAQKQIEQARRKKVQSFKLNFDDSSFSASGSNGTSDVQKSPKAAENDVLDEIVKQAKSGVNGNSSGAGSNRFLKEKTEEELKRDAEIDRIINSERELSSSKAIESTASYDTNITSYSGEQQKQKMDREEKEALKNYKKTVKRRKKAKAERNGCMFKIVWLSMVLLMAGVLGSFLITGVNDLLAISRSEENEVLVTIPENASLDEVSEILSENGIINEEFFFKAYATITKSTEGFLPGTYNMETNMDYEAILNYLLYNSGPKDYVSVQFTEGMTVLECAKKLEENNVCKIKDFVEACNSDEFDEDYPFIKQIGKVEGREYKLEGYLFPDTYIFYLNEKPENVIEKFLDNFNKKVFKNTKKYSGYSEEMSIAELAELKGIELDDLINMASLVQAEAADEADMYYISSVFYNRLSTDVTGGISPYGDYDVNKLKSDATIYYPYSSLDDIPDDIAKTFKSSYNTYNITGLPPGAICNPGATALDAALVPKDTGYYYFCHKAATETEPAEAYYAYTYSEHLQNQIAAGLSPEE
ncbi:MAG: endolytic transglycosylase MltG [Acutalibacteraceae bacterium]